MPFRPLRDDEKAEVQKKLEKAEEEIKLKLSYVLELKRQLSEGTWYGD